MAGKLKNLMEYIKYWRKGIIERNRKNVTEFTNKINSIDIQDEKDLINDEQRMSHQNAYQEIMKIECLHIEDLKQKSRIRWALDWDENSSCFHGLINKNHMSQRINRLKYNGIWINDPEAIKEVMVKHFSGRFVELIKSRPKFICPSFKKLPSHMAAFLEEQSCLMK